MHFFDCLGAFEKKLGAFLIFVVHFLIKPGASTEIVVHFRKTVVQSLFSWCILGGVMQPEIIIRYHNQNKPLAIYEVSLCKSQCSLWLHYRNADISNKAMDAGFIDYFSMGTGMVSEIQGLFIFCKESCKFVPVPGKPVFVLRCGESA